MNTKRGRCCLEKNTNLRRGWQELKRDLKKMKTLLGDTQIQLDRKKVEAPGETVLRQLYNQLEGVKCIQTMTFKAKQGLEKRLLKMQSRLQNAHRQKHLAKMLKKLKDVKKPAEGAAG